MDKRVFVRISGTDRYDHVPVTDDGELCDAPYSVLGGLIDAEHLMGEVYETVSYWASEGIVCGEETLSDGTVIVGGLD